MNTPNYNIYLFLRKTRPNKEGKVPIYIRITVNNERMQYPSGQNIHEAHWDETKQKAIKAKDAGTINSMLTASKANIDQAISQLHLSKSEVSLDNIRLILKGEPVQETHKFLQ